MVPKDLYDELLMKLQAAERKNGELETQLTNLTEKYKGLETPLRIQQKIEDYEWRYGIWVDLDPQERADVLNVGKDLQIAIHAKKWHMMLSTVNRGDIKLLKQRLPPSIELSLDDFADAIAHAHHYNLEYIVHAVGRMVTNQPVGGLPLFLEIITKSIQLLMEPLQIL